MTWSRTLRDSDHRWSVGPYKMTDVTSHRPDRRKSHYTGATELPFHPMALIPIYGIRLHISRVKYICVYSWNIIDVILEFYSDVLFRTLFN